MLCSFSFKTRYLTCDGLDLPEDDLVGLAGLPLLQLLPHTHHDAETCVQRRLHLVGDQLERAQTGVMSYTAHTSTTTTPSARVSTQFPNSSRSILYLHYKDYYTQILTRIRGSRIPAKNKYTILAQLSTIPTFGWTFKILTLKKRKKEKVAKQFKCYSVYNDILSVLEVM